MTTKQKKTKYVTVESVTWSPKTIGTVGAIILLINLRGVGPNWCLVH